MILPLVGFVILDLVYLLNSIFFYQLVADFIMLEFLQDLTGGNTQQTYDMILGFPPLCILQVASLAFKWV